jgi:CheY-like chemotaxis protein
MSLSKMIDAGEETGASACKILIVDDNVDASESLALLLQLYGHETTTAYDGNAAIDVAEQFRPRVILLDIGLPGLNGYEVCREIRARPWGKQAIIAAVTGWGQDEDRRLSVEAGFDHHLVKPVDPEALQDWLAAISADGKLSQ